MKKLILLSLLVIFSCSKDSEEEAVTPGDEIIGTHQIINNPLNNAETSLLSFRNIVDNGIITFTDNYKGFYELEIIDRNTTIRKNFDWSFDGARWDLLEEGGGTRWDISFFDYYTMVPGPENQAIVSREARLYFE